MSELDWIKDDKNIKEKYEKFKGENKVFAQKFDTYDKFAGELIGEAKQEPPANNPENKTENKDNKEQK